MTDRIKRMDPVYDGRRFYSFGCPGSWRDEPRGKEWERSRYKHREGPAEVVRTGVLATDDTDKGAA